MRRGHPMRQELRQEQDRQHESSGGATVLSAASRTAVDVRTWGETFEVDRVRPAFCDDKKEVGLDLGTCG